MSRMKHLLRKLHIGSGGGDGGGVSGGAGSSGGHGDPRHHQHHHHHHGRGVSGPRGLHPRPPAPAPSSSSSTTAVPAGATSASSSTTSPSSSSRGRTVEPSSSETGGARCEGGRSGEGERGFSFFEEEYQVQLALAISVSDPDGREDPESAQMEAAKRMSLACNAAAPVAAAGGAGREDAFEEVLSLRYWRYNTVNYDEKIADGFYDVYGIVSNLNLLGKMPSLVDLQAIPVLDKVEYEVVSVNRALDHPLQKLERRAVSIASECKAAELDPIRSGLVQRISDLVVDFMGGPVDDVNAMIKRWRRKSCELRTYLNTIVLPLGCLQVGLSRHRALLFKVLADRIDLPCRLMKGSHYTGTDDGAIDLIKVDDGSEYIIDLMGAPGSLIPAEIPSCCLQNSGLDLINKDVAQTVKDLCLAIDKKVNCQLEKTAEVSGGPNPPLEIVAPQTQEGTAAGSPSGGHDACDSDANNSTASGDGSWTLLSLSNGSQLDTCVSEEAASPTHQKKVNDVSRYVVTAAKNPEFAQKLHAVLLESGASPPPDLFQDISSTLDVGEHKDPLGNKHSAERKLGKQNLDSDSNSSAKSGHQGLHLLSYGEQLCAHSLSHNVDPGNMGFMHSSVEPNVQCSHINCAETVEETKTEGTDPLKNCEKSTEDKFRLMTNSDSSRSSEGRLNQVLNDVADWEISWEDVQIGERIGLGSYGEVYRADWHGTEVAVKKFLDQDLSGDALEQFRCEVKIMLRLRHPNVVLFMGAVTRPPNLSILTEFLPRGSLYRLLHRANTQLDEKRRLRMAMDVAKGMNYLHISHPTIVHRDLKSPNLLVDKNWVVKVCDFGLSRLQHHTFLSSKSTAGTPEWMAPEVLRNEPSNEKCDVYSFGVILWELATLRMPWSGMNPMQVVGAVGFQNKRLEIPKDVDPMVAQVICDCWHSEPNRRPSFSQLMVQLKHLHHLVVDG